MKSKEPFDALTRTERAVCEAVLRGRTYKQIATERGVEPKTVRQHMSHAYRKLGLSSRDQLLRKFRDRGARQTKQRRCALDESKLFQSPARDGVERVDDELKRGRSWWAELGDSGGWLGQLFTYWIKSVSLPPRTLSYELDPSVELTSATLGWGVDRPYDKAVLLAASGMLTDKEHVLHVGRTNFGMAEAASREIEHHEKLSFFCTNIPGRNPAPSKLAVHATLVTSDGYVLLARRSGAVSWYQHAWSATFEEQVELWPEGHGWSDEPDKTVADTFHRGLKQELHPAANETIIVEETCTGIGLHWDTAEPIMDPAILVVARLAVDVDQAWQWIPDRRRTPDAAEAEAWIAAPFRSLDEAAALLDIQRASVADLEQLEGVAQHPANPPAWPGARWHPTSRGRLFLAAEWLELD
jgi:DNA-binding CsgD family transcriptional regulator